MPLDPANNLAETELTASVSDTATTLPVADAGVFPDADSEGAFNVLVWDANANINPSDAPDAEFVRVTSVDTTADELTVQRGQEDTSASAKASGSTVTDTWSVKDRDDIDAGIAGKADDPHGSESHSSEVVHEGEDAAFGDTTHDSVSTERLGNARRQVNNDLSASELNGIIDSLSSGEDGNGGTIDIDPEVTVTVSSETVTLKSDVLIDFNWATVTAEDNLDDDYPRHGLVQFDRDPAAHNAHIRNVRIDGNAENNLGFGSRMHRAGIHMNNWGVDENNDRDLGDYPEGCSVVNAEISETIMSSILFGGKNCYVDNLFLSDSVEDHLLYLTAPIHSHAENIWCSGYARAAMVDLSDEDSQGVDSPLIGNTVKNVTVTNPTPKTPTDAGLEWALEVRRERVDMRNNTIRDFHIENDDVGSNLRVINRGRVKIDGLSYHGPLTPSGLVRVVGTAIGGSIHGLNYTITDIPDGASNVPVVDIDGGADVEFHNPTIQSDFDESDVRGFELTASDGDIDNLEINRPVIETGDWGVRINDGSNDINNLAITHTDRVNEGDLEFNIDSGAVNYYADGTLIPFDVRNVPNPEDGRINYHDGSGNANEGPAVYNGGWTVFDSGTAP